MTHQGLVIGAETRGRRCPASAPLWPSCPGVAEDERWGMVCDLGVHDSMKSVLHLPSSAAECWLRKADSEILLQERRIRA